MAAEHVLAPGLGSVRVRGELVVLEQSLLEFERRVGAKLRRSGRLAFPLLRELQYPRGD